MGGGIAKMKFVDDFESSIGVTGGGKIVKIRKKQLLLMDLSSITPQIHQTYIEVAKMPLS